MGPLLELAASAQEKRVSAIANTGLEAESSEHMAPLSSHQQHSCCSNIIPLLYPYMGIFQSLWIFYSLER